MDTTESRVAGGLVPDVVLVRIFDVVDLPTLSAAAAATRQWRRAARTLALWQGFVVRRWPGVWAALEKPTAVDARALYRRLARPRAWRSTTPADVTVLFEVVCNNATLLSTTARLDDMARASRAAGFGAGMYRLRPARDARRRRDLLRPPLPRRAPRPSRPREAHKGPAPRLALVSPPRATWDAVDASQHEYAAWRAYDKKRVYALTDLPSKKLKDACELETRRGPQALARTMAPSRRQEPRELPSGPLQHDELRAVWLPRKHLEVWLDTPSFTRVVTGTVVRCSQLINGARLVPST